MMAPKEQSERRLWEQFFSLTQEMLKFLKREQIDMFLSLLEQRRQVQKLIEDEPERQYCRTEEGQSLIRRLQPLNADIQYHAQVWLNTRKKSQKMARAYDSLGLQKGGQILNQRF